MSTGFGTHSQCACNVIKLSFVTFKFSHYIYSSTTFLQYYSRKNTNNNIRHNMDTMDNIDEPMDVDLSGNSAKLDVSYIESDDGVFSGKGNSQTEETVETAFNHSVSEQPRKIIKTYHIKMNRNKSENKPLINNYFMLILFGLFILVVSIVCHLTINLKCTEELNLRYLEENLSTKVFGQINAINAIIETLSINVSSKIMFLYGGTGVGKTFTTSLIYKQYWKSSNIYHYTMPSFANTFSTEFLFGMTMCQTSTVVVDNLTPNDMYIKSLIKDVIAKSEYLNKNITVILIFNCDNITGDYVKKCDETFSTELNKSFGDIKVMKKLIKFDQLTEEHLIKCIEKELGSTRVSPRHMKNILKNFNVTLDGCKGVHTKIKFLNIV